ncbi:hypothetical protein ACFFUE_10225 [Bergeyella porcorum]|uniref:hypothetical protein n=1 Tax=Bergeyella porcorum TaxID=1735111 RepID=UPI0035EB5691
MKNSTPETIKELLDEIATINAIKEDLPTRYAFVVAQYIQRLQEYLEKILTIEIEQKTPQKSKTNDTAKNHSTRRK